MKKYKKIICFDIDNTICSTISNKYNKSKPKITVINIINKLYDRGYYIKIFTSRFMGRNSENSIKAKRQGFKFTANQLKKWKLKYHELLFGKPSYDLFVDDKSIFYKKKWYLNIDKYL